MTSGKTGSTTPVAPRNDVPPLKGALVSIDSTNKKTVVRFQYNPETLRRSLRPNTVGGDQGDRSRAVRYTGAPVETISVEVDIDVVDQLDDRREHVREVAQAFGVRPLMATLELLLYPTTDQVTTIQTNAQAGAIEVVPMTAPRLHFVWGTGRVVPVRLTGLTVLEEFFGANLATVRATVSLEMRVLSYSDVFPSNPDYQAFLTYQKSLETVAKLAGLENPRRGSGG